MQIMTTFNLYFQRIFKNKRIRYFVGEAKNVEQNY